jgi:NADPH:quinone reductase-like Zn-dependent oxidoreductase
MSEGLGSDGRVDRMKAVLCRKPGRPDVLELDEVERPTIAEDGVLVRVHAASVNPVDFFPLSRVAYAARWLSGGFRAKPVVLGTDFAGTIESVGKSVTEFKPGDQVFGGKDRSTFAEYVALPAKGAVVAKQRTSPSSRLPPSPLPPSRRCKRCATTDAFDKARRC